MKFTVSSSLLLKKLQIIGGVIGTNVPVPILDNFLLELSGGRLAISASDMDTTIRGTIDVDSQDEFSIAVPSKILVDMLKTFSEQPLTFNVLDNNEIEIDASTGKYSLAYFNGVDFPKPVEVENTSRIEIMGDVLATAIQKTIFAVSNEDIKPALTGVLFDIKKEGVTFVSTDTHKLVKYERTDVKTDRESSFVMPKKTLNLLKNIIGGNDVVVVIEYNDNNAKFSFDSLEIICRLIEGNFPNYQSVIPMDNPNKLTVDRGSFTNSVRRLSLFTSRTNYLVKVSLSQENITISAENSEYNSKAVEDLQCTYQGDKMEIGFNSKFLLEMLNNLSCENVEIGMSLPNRPGILTAVDGLEEGENIVMLVSPIIL